MYLFYILVGRSFKSHAAPTVGEILLMIFVCILYNQREMPEAVPPELTIIMT